ncbi:MAG: helix-turn-helix transcriptional regulator, partial [Solirubrobacterales bacterium]|nr:helix-turn-helix transcriptional regulator [Solirubrobacterales bacterium]
MSSEKRRYQLKARAESQRQTRERIVRATMELHREVGPAQTTIAEIARRAGVQRLTVYNHFPEEAELFEA